MSVNKKQLAIAACVVGAIAIVGGSAFAAYMMGARNTEEPQQVVESLTGGRGMILLPDTEETVQEVSQRRSPPLRFTTSMHTNWVFPNGAEPITDAVVGNSERNETTMYFDVVLHETGERVFSSPFIPVGASLEGFELDVELPPGDHRARATFFLVCDDFEYLTHVNITVTLQVLA